MDILITSSLTTLEWLKRIKSKINVKIPSLIYREYKYWASFKNPRTNRKVIHLQPQKTQIRLFTRLDPSFDNVLQPTPASRDWALKYPSIFLIRSENAIEKAVKLIISSYEQDLQL
ncbi:MAG: hypothetical protein IBV53_00910 [Candidatus Atribacteria bacterium]